MTITDLAALFGLIFGLVVTVISVVKYFNSKIRGRLSVQLATKVFPDISPNGEQFIMYSLTNIGSTHFFLAGIGGLRKDNKRFTIPLPDTTQQLPYKLGAREMWYGAANCDILSDTKEFWAWDSTDKCFKIKGRKARKLIIQMIESLEHLEKTV